MTEDEKLATWRAWKDATNNYWRMCELVGVGLSFEDAGAIAAIEKMRRAHQAYLIAYGRDDDGPTEPQD
jgi:hypothetical protein